MLAALVGLTFLNGGLLPFFLVRCMYSFLRPHPRPTEALPFRSCLLTMPLHARPNVSRFSFCLRCCFFFCFLVFFFFQDLDSFVEDAIAIGNALTLRRLLNQVSEKSPLVAGGGDDSLTAPCFASAGTWYYRTSNRAMIVSHGKCHKISLVVV